MSRRSAPPPEVKEIDDELVDALAGVAFTVIALLTRLAAEEDLSLTQLRLLAILRDRSPRMAELANALGVDRSSVTGLIARAEQRGLVARLVVEEDGRGVLVQLTDEGRAFARRLTRRTAAVLSGLTVGIEPAKHQDLLSMLALINES